MLKRIITAVCALCVFIPVLYFSDTVIFPAAMTLLSVIAAYEMLNCLGAKKICRLAIPSYLLAVSPMVPYIDHTSEKINTFHVLFVLVCLYLTYLLTIAVFSKGAFKFEFIASVFTAIFYVIITFTSIVALRYTSNGKYIYLLVFIGPWVSDTFAYFCGRLFGRHKLIPEVSPKKTVEGSIGGILFTALSCVIYGVIINTMLDSPVSLTYGSLVVTGAIVSVISQIGDLAASLIKRNYGIKDYGFIFPGHGGVLDRFDSVLLTAPILLIVSSLLVDSNILV